MERGLGVALSGIAVTLFAVVLAIIGRVAATFLLGLAGVALTIGGGFVLEQS